MIPSGPNEHLFAVAFGPAVISGYGPEPQVILVSFSSIKPGLPYDNTCEVMPGEHPFISKGSYIYYREPRICAMSLVQQRVATNYWRPQQACSTDLIQKIVNGFRRSRRLPGYVNEILDQVGY